MIEKIKDVFKNKSFAWPIFEAHTMAQSQTIYGGDELRIKIEQIAEILATNNGEVRDVFGLI